MAAEPGSCPKCHGGMTQFQGGIAYCAKCGFEGEEVKPDVEAVKGRSPKWFWIALVSPAALALASFTVGSISEKARGAGAMIGMAGLLLGFIGAIYCGWWLARRFCKPGPGRVFAGLFLAVVIGLANLFMVVAGCSSNLSFR